MNVEHFGLTRPPFGAIASGQDVFLGPQTANTMKALSKALSTQDAILTVSGPVGVGKTAIVGRALDALGGKQTRIRIGRMSIAHDEILDFLLDVLGVENPPPSTIRRIAMFRAILAQKREEGERVIVIVEDGARLGEEPLAEIEALTAADGGAGGGAAVIVMGDPALATALDVPTLERLNQRVRLRHELAPLSEDELGGYLKHCFRLSGGDFDQLFEQGSTALLHQLAGGIPRVCNNLVESSLAAAAEQGESSLGLDLLRQIAKDEYGLTGESSSADVSQVAEALVVPTDDASREPEVSPEPDTAEPTPESTDDDIPELIHETIPELTELVEDVPDIEPANADIPTLAVAEEPIAEAPAAEAVATPAAAVEAPPRDPEPKAGTPDPAPSPDPEDAAPAPEPIAPEPMAPELTLAPDPAPKAGRVDVDDAPGLAPDSPDEDLPDWEKEATLAELRPDIEALESALAEVKGSAKEEPEPMPVVEPDVEVELKDPSLPAIPELKLDESIQKSIDEAEAALEKQASTIAEGREADKLAEDAPVPEEQPSKADGQLEKIARGLAQAKTLDDIDDRTAETLFGEEFSMVAAEVAAKVASMNLDVEDKTDEEDEPKEEAPATEPKPAAATQIDNAEQAAPSARPRLDSSPSERLKTLRALNAGQATGQPAAADKPAAKATAQPASIENQFAEIAPKEPDSAIVLDAANDDDNDDDEGKKGGFFSRFKR